MFTHKQQQLAALLAWCASRTFTLVCDHQAKEQTHIGPVNDYFMIVSFLDCNYEIGANNDQCTARHSPVHLASVFTKIVVFNL